MDRALTVSAGALAIRVASLDDLIAMKRRAGRVRRMSFLSSAFSAANVAGPAEGVRPGFTCEVSEEMQARFAASTPLQRFEWLKDMRTFTWNAATDVVRAECRRLREHPKPRR